MKKVTILGLGYIGLPTALFFAKSGYEVTGVDVIEATVNKLKNKEIPFEEPGMEELFNAAYDNITFSTKPVAADAFIIAVPTPFLADRTIDEKYINTAFDDISSLLKVGDIVILESTVPPMITEKLKAKIEELGFEVGKDIHLAHVPETIIPGNMVKEFVSNKRLIGGYTKACADVAADLYRPLVEGEVIKSDIRTAEFVKVIENTYRDVNIALANELMHLADEMEIDVYEAIDIANKHPRVNIHTPGGGVGGHCISVDPWFLVGIFGKDKAKIINTAREINDSQPAYIFDKLNGKYNLMEKKVGVFGLSYKPNIDDFRESPSFTFIDILKSKGIDYISYDPYAVTKVEENQVFDEEEFRTSCDIVICYVEHADRNPEYIGLR